MDTQVDQRFQRAWSFFRGNAPELILASLVVALGWVLLVPGPWFTLNLLGEVIDCLRTGRPVRWQAAYDRPGLLLKSWGLLLTMSAGVGIGLAACLAPGTALALAWMEAPARVADGRPVLDALSESVRAVGASWTAATLNALVLLAMAGLSLLTGIVFLLTLPLGLAYLALCYLDESQPLLAAPTDAQPVSA